eukprot:XP_001694287.1 predicted protein [Chlamydomonas reinhardtii]
MPKSEEDRVGGRAAANEVLLPMGATGLALPLVVYAMTMTSLRLGFGAAGVAAAQSPDIRGTALGAFLRSLPPLLYLLTTANLYLNYPGALHCFRKAVLLNPSHVRAHYSMGQVHSLTAPLSLCVW